MAMSFTSTIKFTSSNPKTSTVKHQFNTISTPKENHPIVRTVLNCNSSSTEPTNQIEAETKAEKSKLEIGSPIIVIEAPKMMKTAATVPCLKANSGLVKAGDVGRVVSRKPKDVWAIRLAIGTYLIDGKYFKPLDLEE